MVEWTVVVRAVDGGGVHACVGPTSSSHVDGGAPSSDLMSYIFLFKKTIVVTGPANINRPIATVAQYQWIRPSHRYCATTIATR
jgi:hypothetical protein